jgi:hypothetical protein
MHRNRIQCRGNLDGFQDCRIPGQSQGFVASGNQAPQLELRSTGRETSRYRGERVGPQSFEQDQPRRLHGGVPDPMLRSYWMPIISA